MTDTPNIDPDLATGAPVSDASDNEQQEAPDIEVPSTDDVDPDDGTDKDDIPVDNPAG